MNAVTPKFHSATAVVDEAAIRPLPMSRKIYVEGSRPDIRVPMRKISQSDTADSFGGEKNPPIYVYDTSGPYTDPDVAIDIRSGLACPRTPWNEADCQWLQSKGVRVQFRASLEQDLAAMHEFEPDLAIGTTPIVQAAKELSTPALYFTNLISARPLMGPAGAGSLATVVNAAIGNKARFDKMKDFFGSVGSGHATGVWEPAGGVPQDRPEFKADQRRHALKLAKKRKAEEMI